MNTQEIVAKLWNLCNVLRDDGITYHQYVTELTYILFLKMAKETETEKNIPEQYRWDNLVNKNGIELKNFYRELLNALGGNEKDSKKGSNNEADEVATDNKLNENNEVDNDNKSNENNEEDANNKSRIREIYQGAVTNIEEPKNLEKIIKAIDALDWYSAKEEGLGNLYEGLLEKNANEKKSGAGQYFTPRVLIDVIVELIAPQAGERCNDPACGTFGFMISADKYVKSQTDDYDDLDEEQREFQYKEAFTGCELVHDTHRLALMNAMLHDIDGDIMLADTLSNQGKELKDFDVVLANPPFGTKKGGERATRDDFTFPTSNKQLNFLQHIYRSLKANGKARAGVVLPDNVLFADGDGEKIRADLMDKCNLHTILRLPTGIFYAQGVKTNVLFFIRGKTDKDNTKEVWFYDLRTNMPSFGKTNPLKKSDFADFIKAYKAEDRHKVQDERFSVFTREQIAEKGNSLDLGLIKDDSILDYEDLPNPIDCTEEMIADLSNAQALLNEVVNELKSLENSEV